MNGCSKVFKKLEHSSPKDSLQKNLLAIMKITFSSQILILIIVTDSLIKELLRSNIMFNNHQCSLGNEFGFFTIEKHETVK